MPDLKESKKTLDNQTNTTNNETNDNEATNKPSYYEPYELLQKASFNPYLLYNNELMQLQQIIGNNAVEQLLTPNPQNNTNKLNNTNKGATDYSINTVANNIQRLEELAKKYKESTGDSTSVTELVLQYLRRGDRYSGGNWPAVAGEIASDFTSYVGINASDLSDYFSDNIMIKDPLTQNEVDFIHLIATLNGYIYDTGFSDTNVKALIPKSQNKNKVLQKLNIVAGTAIDAAAKGFMPEYHINNLSGWAGDLQTLIIDVINQTNNSDNYNELYDKTIELLGTTDPSKESTFPMNDLLADTDAYNIYTQLGSSTLSSAFKSYYSGGNKTRFQDFTGNRTKEAISNLTSNYTEDYYMMIKKWPLLNNTDVSETQSKAVKDAFTDFIWNKVQKEKSNSNNKQNLNTTTKNEEPEKKVNENVLVNNVEKYVNFRFTDKDGTTSENLQIYYEWGGKMSLEQLNTKMQELGLSANDPNLQEKVTKLAKDKSIKLGIDCSGFVLRVINEATNGEAALYYKKALNLKENYDVLNWGISADNLTSLNYSSKITSFSNIKVGDYIRFDNGKHVGIIYKIKDNIIYYAHSSGGKGPHTATITVTATGMLGLDLAKSNNAKFDDWDQGYSIFIQKIFNYICRPKFAVSDYQKISQEVPQSPVVNNQADNTQTNSNIYIVKAGDALATIARKYQTTVDEIAKLNNIENVNLIKIGQELKIPNNSSVNTTVTDITSQEIIKEQDTNIVSTSQTTNNSTEESNTLAQSLAKSHNSGTPILNMGNSQLGDLSKQYESKGDSTAINPGTWDKTGGKSYGKYQFAGRITSDGKWIDGYNSNKNEVQGFINWLEKQGDKGKEYADILKKAKSDDGDKYGINFDKSWKSIAIQKDFQNLEHAYAANNWFMNAADKISKSTGDEAILDKMSYTMQNVLWSVAIQHGTGGANSIFSKILTLGWETKDEATLIKEIYKAREPYVKEKYPQIITGRYKDELEDALNMLNTYKEVQTTDNQNTDDIEIVPYTEEHIPTTTAHNRRPGTSLSATTLTIHSTANSSSTASNERNWLINPSNERTASFHIVVDQSTAIECIPLDEVAYHAGTVSGNRSSISIEICESGNREKTLANAINLTATILKNRGWGIEQLRQHNDWSGKNCPRILRTLKNKDHQTWDWFKSEVAKKL